MAKNPTGRDVKTRIPDLRGLREFSESTDRETPVAFVGREEQIGALKRDLEARFRQRQGWEGPGFPPAWEGATWLFQGAPGAGKTALLRHLKNLKVNGRAVRVCLIDDEADLHDDFRLKRKIAEAFVPGSAAKMVGTDTTQTGKGAKVGGGVSGFGTRLEGSADASKGRSEQRAGLTWEDFANKEKSQSSSPLLLLFDEAQALEDRAGPQLRWLHKGEHGLPIIPVFGGLAWTKERFGELGISRFSGGRVHTLEALSEGDCKEVVQAFFSIFRVVGSEQEREEWAKTIARESMGWPQHLHAGLQGLAEALAEAGGVLEGTDRPKALKGVADRRQEYYEARISSFERNFHEVRFLAAALVAYMHKKESGRPSTMRLGAAIDRGHVQRLALDWPGMNLEEDDPDLALPEGVSGKDLVRAMVHAGIFHKGENGMLHVPIPSFADHLCSKLDWLAARSGESPQKDPRNFASVIRARIEPPGGVDLELPPRDHGREPPSFD